MPEAVTAPPETGYYVYAVVPAAGAAAPGVRGIDDVEVELVEHGDVAAAVAEIALDRPPGRSAELRAHGRVVEALAGAGPVVPAQFGGLLARREDVVSEILAPGHDRLREVLASLRGTRQYRLRATYVAEQVLAEVVRADPGIADLSARTRHLGEGEPHPDKVRLGELVSAAMADKRLDDVETVMAVVRPLVLEEAPQAGSGVDHLHAVALLVAEDRVAELEEALEALAEAVHERIRLALSGPTAPYDFVEGATWD